MAAADDTQTQGSTIVLCWRHPVVSEAPTSAYVCILQVIACVPEVHASMLLLRSTLLAYPTHGLRRYAAPDTELGRLHGLVTADTPSRALLTIPQTQGSTIVLCWRHPVVPEALPSKLAHDPCTMPLAEHACIQHRKCTGAGGDGDMKWAPVPGNKGQCGEWGMHTCSEGGYSNTGRVKHRPASQRKTGVALVQPHERFWELGAVLPVRKAIWWPFLPSAAGQQRGGEDVWRAAAGGEAV
jgi:hypothetical protein